MTSMSILLQDNFCGKHSWKFIKYSQSYDTVCQLELLGIKGLTNEMQNKTSPDLVIHISLRLRLVIHI